MSYNLSFPNTSNVYCGEITINAVDAYGTFVSPIITNSNVLCSNLHAEFADFCINTVTRSNVANIALALKTDTSVINLGGAMTPLPGMYLRASSDVAAHWAYAYVQGNTVMHSVWADFANNASGNITSNVLTILNDPINGYVLTGVTGNTAQWEPSTGGNSNVLVDAVGSGLLYHTGVLANVDGYAPLEVSSLLVSNLTSQTVEIGGDLSVTGTITGNIVSLLDLTGPIAATNSVTSITAQTGTGTTFVMQNTPTLTTPVIGAATGTSLDVTGTVQGSQLISDVSIGTAPLAVTSTTLVNNLYVARAALADTCTTIPNLTGPITSSGVATSVAAQTGTGSTFVMQNTPTLTTPVIGAATGTSLDVSGALQGASLTADAVTNQLVLGTTNTTTISSTAPSASRTVTLHDAGAASNFVLDTGGALTITNTATTDYVLTGTGTNTATWQVATSGSGYGVGDLVTSAKILSAPTYLRCNSQVVSTTTYSNLFDELGYANAFNPGVALSNPAALPPSASWACRFDSSNTYLAVANDPTTPFITIYKRSGTTFTKLSDPGSLPPGSGLACDWTQDTNYLAVGGVTTPFLTIYSRSGDTFTKIADPASIPTNIIRGMAYSTSGTYLAVSVQTTPFVEIYKITGGTTYTKLANPAILPTGLAIGCAFSPNDKFLAIGHEVSPFVTIYERSGDTFTKVTNPASLPLNSVTNVSFSADSSLFASMTGTNPCLQIYSISGSTFTLLPYPSTYPVQGSGRVCAFNKLGNRLTVSTAAVPYILTYSYANNVFTALASPATNSHTITYFADYSSDNAFLAVAGAATPFIRTYTVGDYNPSTSFILPQLSYVDDTLKYYLKT